MFISRPLYPDEIMSSRMLKGNHVQLSKMFQAYSAQLTGFATRYDSSYRYTVTTSGDLAVGLFLWNAINLHLVAWIKRLRDSFQATSPRSNAPSRRLLIKHFP